jgi:hypothetical protein
MNIKLKHTLLALITLLSSSLGNVAMADASVGEIIFTVGEVKVLGSKASLKRGDTLAVGQTLLTGSNGHVHIRFIDQAFVSVRPGSELLIEQYLYDQAEPKNNRIKFSLVKGTSRFITGKAGQAAKQNFRLNTPVAAVGIRGTDFVAQSDAFVTRVSVQQGGVTLSSYGLDCSAQALGPCSGALSSELTGSLTGRYLEARGQDKPVLVTPESGTAKPVFSLPRPEEPAAGGKQSSDTKPEFFNNSNNVMWGRWAPGVAAPNGFEMLGHNDAFALYRSQEVLNLPQAGVVNFNLSQANAYSRSSDGVLLPAQINGASLSLNFATMQYATKFDWVFGGEVLHMSNKGELTTDGRFVANRNASNFAISGGLAGQGQEAAYLFIKRLPGDDAYGILHWTK